jgi:hypothetical protein
MNFMEKAWLVEMGGFLKPKKIIFQDDVISDAIHLS